MINNRTPYLKPPKNHNRRAALGRPAIKFLGRGGWGGGASASLAVHLAVAGYVFDGALVCAVFFPRDDFPLQVGTG